MAAVDEGTAAAAVVVVAVIALFQADKASRLRCGQKYNWPCVILQRRSDGVIFFVEAMPSLLVHVAG